MILGFLVVSSVLVVSLGRLGDQFGRIRMYNLGFIVYTVASLLSMGAFASPSRAGVMNSLPARHRGAGGG